MFGISQLHQLRGRVGRGKDQGYCYFIHTDDAKDETVEKLKYLEINTSGFDVAEHDLNTRGAGTYLGTKQSGLPDNYRVTNINDIMNNIHDIKSFTYNLPSAKIKELKKEMKEMAKRLDFEKAAQLRDDIYDAFQPMSSLGISIAATNDANCNSKV